MAFKSILIGLLALSLVSCDKTGSNLRNMGGTYIGYFHRNQQDTAQVTLQFVENSFQGQSSKVYYPAIGKGVFTQKDSTIIFEDSIHWASDIDGSLTLKGNYNYEFNEDGILRIWRQKDNILDEYILRKPVKY